MARDREASTRRGRERNLTLAEFSGRTVQNTLKRQNKRRRRNEEENHNSHAATADDLVFVPPTPTALTGSSLGKERGSTSGQCGATAKRRGDANHKNKEENAGTGLEEQEEDALEWENIGEEYDEEEDEEEEGDVPDNNDNQELVIDVEVLDEFSNDKAKLREWAIQVHRTHLLCLIARGQELDRLASCPLIQGRILSRTPAQLLPSATTTTTTISSSSSSSSRFTPITRGLQLKPLVTFFSRAFKALDMSEDWSRTPKTEKARRRLTSSSSGGGDETTTGTELEDRVHGVIDVFSGREEELVTCFAALCRSLGLMTRLVCVMEPLPRYTKKALLTYKMYQQHQQQHQHQHQHQQNNKQDEDGEAKAAVTRKGDSGGCRSGRELESAPNQKGRSLKSSRGKLERGDRDIQMEIEMASCISKVVKMERGDDDDDDDDVEEEGKGKGKGKGKSKGKDKGNEQTQSLNKKRQALLLRAFASKQSKQKLQQKKHLPRYWVEVCFHGADAAGGLAWESIDPIGGVIGRAEWYENAKLRRKGFACVAAFLGGGLKDVTQRYASVFHTSGKEIDRAWWEETISVKTSLKDDETKFVLQHHDSPGFPAGTKTDATKEKNTSRRGETSAAAGGGEGGDNYRETRPKGLVRTKAEKVLDCQLREEVSMSERTLKQMKANWPRTLTQAKNHPYYCLARHLGKSQALVPGAKFTGKFLKSEPLYLRSDVSELRSKAAWLRLGRQVSEGQEACKETGGNKKSGAKGVGLFGQWQTEKYVPREVGEDKKIPRNEHGNLECPPLVPSLPAGLVHLGNHKGIWKVARQLRVDYVPALTGFERRSGRVYPVITGIVVLAEEAERVLQAHLAEEEKKREEQRRKAMRQAEAGWRWLFKNLLKKKELSQKYNVQEEEVKQGGGKDRGGVHAVEDGAGITPSRGCSSGGGGGGGGGLLLLPDVEREEL